MYLVRVSQTVPALCNMYFDKVSPNRHARVRVFLSLHDGHWLYKNRVQTYTLVRVSQTFEVSPTVTGYIGIACMQTNTLVRVSQTVRVSLMVTGYNRDSLQTLYSCRGIPGSQGIPLTVTGYTGIA